MTLSGSRSASASSPAGQQPVLAHRAGPAALEAPGRRRPALGDQRQRGRLEHLEVALDALAARLAPRRRRSPGAAAAAAPAAGRPAPAPRSACCGCWSCAVCTPLMPGRGRPRRPARRPRSRSTPSRSLPMSTLFIVPCDGGADPPGQRLGQRAEAHVGHPLADLDVAGADRGRRRGRRRSCPAGATTRDRPQRAAVGRQGRVDARPAAAKATDAHRHRLDRVDVAGPLRVGAGEVERDRRRRRWSRSRTMVGDLLVGRGAEAVDARRRSATCRRAGRPARPACAARRSRAPRRAARRPSAARRVDAHDVGADLGVEVAGPLVGRAGVGQQQGPHLGGEPHRRDAQALGVDLGGVGGHRARARRRRRRRGGPGWRPSPTRRARPTKQGATTVMSLRWVPPANGSLRMICSPGPSGVGARRPKRSIAARHRRRHRPEVHGDVLGLGQQLAVGGEHARPSSRPAP